MDVRLLRPTGGRHDIAIVEGCKLDVRWTGLELEAVGNGETSQETGKESSAFSFQL